MGTFKQQIEGLVGTISVDTYLDDFLSEGAKYVINTLPAGIFRRNAVDLTDADGTTGISVAGHKVLFAHKAGFPCKEVPASMKGVCADSTSLLKATAKSPVMYLETEKGYVLPSGGIIKAIPYPTVTNGSSSVSTAFPHELEPALVLYAAGQVKLQEVSTKLAALAAVTNTTTTVPTTISASAITIGSLGTAPTFSAVTPPTILGDTITSLDIVATAPTAPSLSTTLTGTPPTYTAPTLSVTTELGHVETELSTNQDIELALGHLNKVKGLTEEYQARVGNAVQAFTQGRVAYEADIQKDFENLHAVLAKYQSQIQSYQQSVNAEVEEYQANLKKHETVGGVVLQGYQLAIQQALDAFNKELAIYQASNQKVLAQAQLDEARVLTKYRSDIDSFQAEVAMKANILQNEVARFGTLITSALKQAELFAARLQRFLMVFLPQPQVQGQG
jgi:hypothetical protein